MTHTIKDYYKCVINFIHSGSQVFQGTGFKPAFHERRKHERKHKRNHKYQNVSFSLCLSLWLRSRYASENQTIYANTTDLIMFSKLKHSF